MRNAVFLSIERSMGTILELIWPRAIAHTQREAETFINNLLEQFFHYEIMTTLLAKHIISWGRTVNGSPFA